MAFQTKRIERIVKMLRDWGFTVRFEHGWRTRGGSTFEPRGFVDHHDVSPTHLNWGVYNIIVNGRSDLPGPLANFVLARDGQIAVIAAGRANHAGSGGWQGLSGNSSVWGCEAANTGTGEPWGKRQLEAYRALNLAAEVEGGYARINTCGHKEWTPRKIDPEGIDMPEHRKQMGSADNVTEDDVYLYGDSNAKQLQKLLNKVGKNQNVKDNWYPLTVDGDYGDATAKAVKTARGLSWMGGSNREVQSADAAAFAVLAYADHRLDNQSERLASLLEAIGALEAAIASLQDATMPGGELPPDVVRTGDRIVLEKP